MAQRGCDECKSQSGFVDGQLVCTACGLVQDNIIIGADLPLCSSVGHEFYKDNGLSPQAKADYRTSHEELLYNICSNQNIPRCFADEAFQKFQDLKVKIGLAAKEKSLVSALIACLYSTLKRNDSSFTLIELRAYADFEPRKVIYYYNLYLHDPEVVLLPSDIVFRLCSRLNLSRQDSTTIFDLTRKWETENNYASKPETVVAGMICDFYLKNGLSNVDGETFKSSAQICNLCFVNSNTVRRFMKKYQLLPK